MGSPFLFLQKKKELNALPDRHQMHQNWSISRRLFISHTLYIFSSSPIVFFYIFGGQCCGKLLKREGGGRNPLHLSKRERCVSAIFKIILVLAMKLVICWSTSHYQKDIFLVLGRGVSNLLEMFLVLASRT